MYWALKSETIVEGSDSGIGQRGFHRVTNQADWKKLWDDHCSTQFPAPNLPEVDFSQEMVVAVFAGEQNNGGCQICIFSVEDEGNSVLVLYDETEPQGIAAAVMSQAFHIVRVESSDKPIRFQGRDKDLADLHHTPDDDFYARCPDILQDPEEEPDEDNLPHVAARADYALTFLGEYIDAAAAARGISHDEACTLIKNLDHKFIAEVYELAAINEEP